MKYPLLSWLAAGVVMCSVTGCGHVDLTPEGDPHRLITGTVNVRMDLLPPPDAEVVVRVVQPSDVTAAPTTVAKDLVLGERGPRLQPETVVAEQVIRAPASLPVPFQIDTQIPDADLRRGLTLDARISWGGRVRFRTLESQAVTLATIGDPHAIVVEPVQ